MCLTSRIVYTTIYNIRTVHNIISTVVRDYNIVYTCVQMSPTINGWRYENKSYNIPVI
jgi:hypothetical protein